MPNLSNNANKTTRTIVIALITVGVIAAGLVALVFFNNKTAPAVSTFTTGQNSSSKTKLQIRAFHDDNNDGQYGEASKPGDPSFEGAFFISADIDIINEATGKQLKLAKICNNDGHLGGVGREYCSLPNGSYTVKFNGEVTGLTGPLKSRYNGRGINPVAHVVVGGSTVPIVEFGYRGRPTNGVLLIRKYVDLDKNGEYGDGQASTTSTEGTIFQGTTYKLSQVTSSKLVPVDPAKCFDGDFKLGGVGRDYCFLPSGIYQVDVDPNPNPASYQGPIKEKHNAGGFDPAWITVKPDAKGAGNPNILDFGYRKITSSPPSSQKTVSRCGGENVVDQLVACSRQLYPNPQVASGIFLCRNNLFFDCFTGTPLMQKDNLTFLATDTNKLSANTKTEITRILANRNPAQLKFIIAGQAAAVSTSVQREIEAMGFKVERIGGANRRETARLLSEKLIAQSAGLDTVEISEDEFGVDALGISPVAARPLATNGNNGRAILLTKRAATAPLNDSVKNFFGAHKNQIKKVEIIGGAAAVPTQIESELKTLIPGLSVTRINGTNRVDTNSQIAQKYFPKPSSAVLAFGRAIQATGYRQGLAHYAALTGARLAAAYNGPLLYSITSTAIPTSTESYLSTNAATIDRGYIAGSLSLISKTVADRFTKLIK